jgi:hypothetical protein
MTQSEFFLSLVFEVGWLCTNAFWRLCFSLCFWFGLFIGVFELLVFGAKFFQHGCWNLRIIRGDFITFICSDEFKRRFLAGIALNVLGGIAIVFAITIIIGAILIFNQMEVAGGTVVIIFSLLSIIVSSG